VLRDDNGLMLAGPEPLPSSPTTPPGHFTVRLVGDADAVAWVSENLRGPGLGVEATPLDVSGPSVRLAGPIVWVARPGQPEAGKTVVDDAAVWSFPCLVVIPPGGAAPDILAGHPSVESFEVVREPDDAPILRMRLERLLLLHRRRAQTEAVLHDLPVIVYTRTLDGILTNVNAEAESFLGRHHSGLVGRPLLDTMAGGTISEADLAEMNDGLLARGRHRMRIVGRISDGRRVALDTRALLLRDGHGTPWGAQVVIADLTDEEAALERLRVAAERSEILAAIATATRDITDLDRILQTVTSIVGLRSGSHTVDVFLADGGQDRLVLRHSWRSSEAIPDLSGDKWLIAGTETYRTLVAAREPFVVPDARHGEAVSRAEEALRRLGAGSGILLPVLVDDEVVAGLGMTYREPRTFSADFTGFLALVAGQLGLAIRAARLYQSLAEKLRALAEEQRLRELADHDRQRLLSMLVHDLKNPLAAVLASLELGLDRTFGDPRLERLLRTSMASARGLAGMIDDALLVYRTGETPAERYPEDVVSVLAQPFEEARWMAEARQVRLDIKIAEPIPPVTLDAGRYRRAAANILSNALKFSRRGGDVEAHVGIEDVDGKSWLVLRVADSGPGVPESVRDRLGGPYQRFTGSERIPGTGLGLTVVGAVALAHGGCIQVEPRPAPGGGSVFSLWIPA
jgi:PAS domain S-box-containing protein